MDTQIIEATDFTRLREVAEEIRKGVVVAAKTDTNYGIFCSPFSEHACSQLYEMKKRDASKPLSLFISGPDDWKRWAYRPRSIDIEGLINAFWPGPLNLVLRKKDVVPDWVTSGMATVSVVYNNSPVVNLLSIFSGIPLAATSANLSGSMDSGGLVDFNTAQQHIGRQVDYMIQDFGAGNTTMRSTIVSLVDEPRILRQGDLTADRIREVVPNLVD